MSEGRLNVVEPLTTATLIGGRAVGRPEVVDHVGEAFLLEETLDTTIAEGPSSAGGQRLGPVESPLSSPFSHFTGIGTGLFLVCPIGEECGRGVEGLRPAVLGDDADAVGLGDVADEVGLPLAGTGTVATLEGALGCVDPLVPDHL